MSGPGIKAGTGAAGPAGPPRRGGLHLRELTAEGRWGWRRWGASCWVGVGGGSVGRSDLPHRLQLQAPGRGRASGSLPRRATRSCGRSVTQDRRRRAGAQGQQRVPPGQGAGARAGPGTPEGSRPAPEGWRTRGSGVGGAQDGPRGPEAPVAGGELISLSPAERLTRQAPSTRAARTATPAAAAGRAAGGTTWAPTHPGVEGQGQGRRDQERSGETGDPGDVTLYSENSDRAAGSRGGGVSGGPGSGSTTTGREAPGGAGRGCRGALPGRRAQA